MYVYKVTNMINGKLYVGRTKNFKERVHYHQTKYTTKKRIQQTFIQGYEKIWN